MGDGINDSIALKKANVSISLRGASSIATDTAQIVFLEEGLAKLCELRDIARDLDHNVKRSWSMILAPNIACIAGVFTMGFGIMASVVTNNVAALAALANGVLPLRKVAQIEAERRHRLEMTQSYALERNPVHSAASAADRRADREAITREYSRRRHEIPVATELQWHPEKPQFTIRSQWLSFVVHFAHEELVVDARAFPCREGARDQEHRQTRRAVHRLDRQGPRALNSFKLSKRIRPPMAAKKARKPVRPAGRSGP